MELPKVKVKAEDWLGQYSNVSPHRVPPGAAISQINMRCTKEGQLDCRGGMTPVTFTNATTSATTSIISMCGYQHPLGQYVVYELADGSIKAGLNPA